MVNLHRKDTIIWYHISAEEKEVCEMIYIMLGIMSVCFALQAFFSKKFSDHFPGDTSCAAIVFSALYGLVTALINMVSTGFNLSTSPMTLLIAAVNAVMLILYNFGLIKAASRGSYSVATVSSLFGSLIIPVFVSFFQSKVPTVIQIVAVGVMLVAFVFLNAEGFRQRTTSKKFYIYCLIIFLSNGIYCSLLSVHSNTYPNEHTELIAITYLISAVFAVVWLIFKKGRRFAREFEITRKSVIFLFLTCVVSTVGLQLVLRILPVLGNAVTYSVEDAAILVISVALSVILFKEKLTPVKTVGIVLALISVLMLTCGDHVLALINA